MSRLFIKEEEMEKTIKLGDKSVRLDNKISWALIYRDQFGHDIIPTLMPLLVSTVDIIGGLISEAGISSGKVGVEDITKVIGSDAYVDAIIHMSGLEVVEFMNIMWAMAKNADDTISDPETWIKSLDVFPLDEVTPLLFDLISRGFMSSKNLTRLRTMLGGLKPLDSTTSSSQDSNED